MTNEMSEPGAQLKEGIGMEFPNTRELPEKNSANLGLLFREAGITKTQLLPWDLNLTIHWLKD